jgi:hypothetical protein
MADASTLFEIPGEIRNRILEYALTSSTPLQYNPPIDDDSRPSFCVSSTKPDGTMVSHEFNVIKYVNRQLYAETAGLEIKLNTLHFSSQEGIRSSPTQHLISFVCLLTPIKKGWLHNVVVHDYMRNAHQKRIPLMEDTPYTIAALIKQSKMCPLLEIHYIISDWRYHKDASASAKTRFLCRGVVYASILGGYDAAGVFEPGSYYDRTHGASIMARHDWWGRAADVEALGSPKIMFIPKICTSLQEVNSDVRNEKFGRIDGIRTHLANEQIRRWIRDGIRCR